MMHVPGVRWWESSLPERRPFGAMRKRETRNEEEEEEEEEQEEGPAWRRLGSVGPFLGFPEVWPVPGAPPSTWHPVIGGAATGEV